MISCAHVIVLIQSKPLIAFCLIAVFTQVLASYLLVIVVTVIGLRCL